MKGYSVGRNRAGGESRMDENRGGDQSDSMSTRLMSQAELMAWEKKARRWVVLGLVGIVSGVFGIGLLTLHMSYAMLKKTEVMQEAIRKVSADRRVVELLGEPIRVGWSVTGEIEDLPDRGTARLDFSVLGSKGLAKVTLRADKSPTGQWRYLLLEVKPLGGLSISCADEAGG
ncbi:MAG: hypothetical protein EB056_04655 [Verrucomicrobia bacterium]|nr:hypothetical protein [Verrucomicrobiota bacterium]